MSLLIVDPGKCRRDGLCVAVCPYKIIQQPEPEAVPALVPGGGEFCIRCGHCLAVCPHDAITLDGTTPESCPPAERDQKIKPAQLELFIRSRRSVRQFKDRPVDRDTIVRLIEIARYAPSGHNGQPVWWKVIHSPGEVSRLAGLVVDWMRDFSIRNVRESRMMQLGLITGAWDAGVDVICWGAPHVVLVHAPLSNPTASRDCIIAMTHLDLAAPSFDLGTCWAGYFMRAAAEWPPLQAALDLPEGHRVHGAVMVGMPRYSYRRLPPRNPPRISWT